MGYMNYLFFLSAYTQDRSGRLVWCLNTDFVDKSKILDNTFNVEFPEDLDTYSRRTILTRQWHDPAYETDLTAEWSIPAASQKLVQFFHDKMDFDEASTSALILTVDANGTGVGGNLITPYTDVHTENMIDSQFVPSAWEINRQLGTSDGVTLTNFFGDWTWEGTLAAVDKTSNHDPLWIPCPSRDWHPYFLLPPMALPQTRGGLTGGHAYNLVLIDENVNYNGITSFNPASNPDPAFSEVWQSWCHVMFYSRSDLVRFFPGRNTEFFVGDGTNHFKATSSMFDFTKQQEWLAWEEYRGFISVTEGKTNEDRGIILVQPSAGAYLTNTMRYTGIEGFTLNKKFSTPELTAMRMSIDATGGGLFRWNFKHEYLWESASFFPTDVTGRIRTGYVNMKYSDETIPGTVIFDAGAWVGWKDDLSAGSNLVWKHADFGVGGTGEGDANIFRQQVPSLALGPEATESIRLLFSLILLNSRRLSPIAGH